MHFDIPKLKYSHTNNFLLIAGPCAIEGKEMAFHIAKELNAICDELEIPFIFKGSFRKANRSRLDSFTGIGDEKALKILEEVGKEFKIPVTTDIHTAEDATLAAPYVDVLQIPAFLCRQTNLLIAAAQTGKVINIKKGQFLNGESMIHAYNKVSQSGNNKIFLTERGTTFGYQDLVVDYRNIPTMKSFGARVILDCTHSLQQPNQKIGVTGGKPEMIDTIARAGIAAGADGLFIETHPEPYKAKSDGANMLPLNQLKAMLIRLLHIRKAVMSDFE